MSAEPSLFAGTLRGPLAARMRPQSIEEILGQDHLLGPGAPLRVALDTGVLSSMVLWGPPGSGKTSVARLLAQRSQHEFELFSAVTEGIPKVRSIIARAEERRASLGIGTVLFCDEIHRFNRAQQDAFLPWVEDGVIVLIGATTENPSFEINSALLSRVQVYVLRALESQHLREIMERATQLLSADGVRVGFDAASMASIVRHADGDARKAINIVEMAANRGESLHQDAPITVGELESILARRVPRYDKSGDQHYDLISALHKSVRGSEVEGALYWLARMIEAGEDVLYIGRRLVRMASEDIGLADPRALEIALSAVDAYRLLGSPEGELAVVEATIYLTTSPKSNRTYAAWGEARKAARNFPNEPVPAHLRNAPTKLLKELGHGRDYRYDHDERSGFAADQRYLPPALTGVKWYVPTERGFEAQIAKRLDWWRQQREGRARDHE